MSAPGPSRNSGARSRSTTLIGGLALVIVAAVVFFSVSGVRLSAQPLDPASPMPTGLRALVTLLERYGADVIVDELPPQDRNVDVLLVPLDDLEPWHRNLLESHARGGAHLVVTDPASPLHRGRARPVTSTTGPVEPQCDLPAATAAGPITAPTLLALDGQGASCYPLDRGALLTSAPLDSGRITSLMSQEAWTNRHLADAGNARLAVELLATTQGRAAGTPGVFIQWPSTSPIIVSEDYASGDLPDEYRDGQTTEHHGQGRREMPTFGRGPRLPTGERPQPFSPPGEDAPGQLPGRWTSATILLALAGLTYGAAVGRRNGPLVDDDPVVTVAASELVTSAAALFRSRKHIDAAQQTIRAELARDLAVDVAGLSTAAARVGAPLDTAARARLDGTISGEEDLASLATDIAAIRRAMRGGRVEPDTNAQTHQRARDDNTQDTP